MPPSRNCHLTCNQIVTCHWPAFCLSNEAGRSKTRKTQAPERRWQNAPDRRDFSAPVHDKEPLFGPLAALAQSHIGGIVLGLVGLLLGSFADSPLFAVAGLLGGFAAGTAFIDKNEGQSTPISQEAIALRTRRHRPR